MKKVFALLLVLVLACALCVPALAAKETLSYNDLVALVNKAPADVKGYATQVVQALDPNETYSVDVDQVKGAYNDLKSILATEKDPGKIEDAIITASAKVGVATGLGYKDLSVKVNAVTGEISVSATITKLDGTEIKSVKATGKAPLINDPGSSDSGSSSNTSSNTAAAAASVIKATGFDASAVVMVVLAIAGVLGVATVKARKLD